jgi:hypothetical protein
MSPPKIRENNMHLYSIELSRTMHNKFFVAATNPTSAYDTLLSALDETEERGYTDMKSIHVVGDSMSGIGDTFEARQGD